MPKDGRQYTFKFNVDNKTLNDAASLIETKLSEAMASGTKLDRSSKAEVKQSLADIFGVAEEQAELLRKVMQGIVQMKPEGIENLKNQLKETLQFTSGIMNAMKNVNESTDWMKQGVGFIDDFKSLQEGLEKTQTIVVELKDTVSDLVNVFSGFENAFKMANPEAYFKRFGKGAEEASKNVEKVKAVLEKSTKLKSLQSFVDKGKDDAIIYDSGMSVEDIREEQQQIYDTIAESLAAIDELKKKYKGNSQGLYSNKEYQRHVQGLSEAYYSLENLRVSQTSFSGINIGAEVMEAAQDAAKIIKEAKGDLESAIKGLDLKDIELSVVLPDAKSAEFSEKINQFIEDTKSQLNAKPLEVSVDLTNPIKTKRGTKLTKGQEENAKEIARKYTDIFNQYIKQAEEGKENAALTDVTDPLFDKQSTTSAQKYLNSFLRIIKMVTNSQELLLKATQDWRNKMDEHLNLKLGWASDDSSTDAELAYLFQKAQEFADNNPLELSIDEDEFLNEIDEALKSRKFSLNADVGTVTGNITGNMNVIPSAVASPIVIQGQSGIQPAIPHAVSATNDDTENTAAIQESTQAEKSSTVATNALERAVNSLGEIIQRKADSVLNSQRTIDSYTEKAGQNSTEIQKYKKEIEDNEAKVQNQREVLGQYLKQKEELNKAIEKENNSYLEDLRYYQQVAKIFRDKGDISSAEEWESEIRRLKSDHEDTVASIQKEIDNIDQKFISPIGTIIRNAQDKIRTAYDKIEELTGEQKIEEQKKKISKTNSSANVFKQRQQDIIDVINSGENPITLVSDSINEFWDKSEKSITSARETIKEVTADSVKIQEEIKPLEEALAKEEKDTEAYHSLVKRIEALKEKAKLSEEDQKVYERAKKSEEAWMARQSFMSSKGLVRDLDFDAVEEILKKSTTLAYDLSHMKDKSMDLSNVRSIEDLAFFVQVVQENMGIVSKTAEQFDVDNNIQQRFLNLFRVMKYINDLNKLTIKKDAKPTEDTLKTFIETYKNIPTMEKAVAAASKYLESIQELAQHTNGNDNYKNLDSKLADQFFPQAIQGLWGKLSKDMQSEVFQALEKSDLRIDSKADMDGDILKDSGIQKLRDALSKGVFGEMSKISPELNELVNILKINASYQKSEEEFKNVLAETSSKFVDGTKTGLRVMLNDENPISVRVVGKNGQEKIYGIQRKGAPRMNADKSFNTTLRGLDDFLKKSGLKDPINQVLALELIDPDAANDLFEQIFASGKYAVSSKKNAFTKTSAKSYTFEDTAYGKASKRKAQIEQIMANPNTTDAMKANLDNELKDLEAILQSKDAKLEAILSLDEDIKIAEAKLTDSNGSRGGYKRTAKRLSRTKTSSRHLQHQAGSRKYAIISGKKSLSSLSPQIDVAAKYGTMDAAVVAELQQLMSGRNEVLAEFNALSEHEQRYGAEGGKLKAKLKEYKDKILEKFYETEGWFVTEVLTDRISAIEGDANEKASAVDRSDSASKQSTQRLKQELENSYSRNADAINTRYNNALIELIGNSDDALSPEMADSMRTANREYEKGVQDIEEQKRKIDERVTKSLEGYYKELFERQSAEMQVIDLEDGERKSLYELRAGQEFQSEEWHKYNNQIQEIEKRHNDEYQAKVKQAREEEWLRLAKQQEELEETHKQKVNAIIEQNDQLVVQRYNELMKSQGKPEVASIDEIRARIEQERKAALEREAADYQQKLSQITAPTDSTATKESIESARNTAVQNAVGELKTAGGQYKSDTDVMAQIARQGAATTKEAAGAAKETVEQLRAKQQALIQESGLSEEVLAAHRQSTEAAQQSAEAAKDKAEAVTHGTNHVAQTGGVAGGYIAAGGILNAGNLATESTLRGIYELLNGGAPVGGWDGTTDQVEQKFNDWSDGIGDTTENFAKSINKIISSAATRKTEAGYLINRFGQVGKTIQGTKHSVPGDKVANELAQHLADGVVAFLHNHPGKNSKHLSPGDVYSSYHLAYDDTQPVKIAGSVNDGVISAINWQGIDKEIAQQIAGRYTYLIREWQSTMPDIYTYDDKKQRYIADGDKIDSDPNLVKLISGKYNDILIQALNEFGYGDAYKQFANAKDFEHWVSINDGIRQAGNDAASIPTEDTLSKAEQAYVDAEVDEILKWMQEKPKSVPSLQEELKASLNGEDEDDGYDYSLKNGIDRSTEAKVQQAQENVANNIVEQGAKAAEQSVKQSSDSSTISIKKALDSSKHPAENILGVAEYIKNQFYSGGQWSSKQAGQLYSGIDSSVLGLYGSLYDINSKDRHSSSVKAYENLQAVMQSDIAKQFDDDTTKFINDLISSLKADLDQYAEQNPPAKKRRSNKNTNTKLQQAQNKVADTVIKQGAKAAETVADNPQLGKIKALIDSTKTQYRDNKKKWTVKGAKQLQSGLYDANILYDGKDINENKELVATAYNKLNDALQAEIGSKLDKDTKEFVSILIAELKAKLDEMGIDPADHTLAKKIARRQAAKVIEGTSLNPESVKATKDSLSAIKGTDGKAATGVHRAKSGFESVYSVLSNGKETLSKSDLKTLGTGYYQLQQTINSKLWEQLSEDTKAMLQEAATLASKTLEQNGVIFAPDENLLKKTVTKDLQKFVQGANKNYPAKIGNVINSIMSPLMMTKDGELLQKAIVSSYAPKDNAGSEKLNAEKQVTKEKEKQSNLSKTEEKNQQKAVNASKEKLKVEQKTTEVKSNAAKQTTTSGVVIPPIGGGINVPVGNGGGIIGILNLLAREATLQQVVELLASKGGSSRSGGRGTQGAGGIDNINAQRMLEQYVAKNYSGVTAQSKNFRATASGYAMDVFRPAASVQGTKEYERMLVVQKEINRLEQEGKANSQEYTNLQIEKNRLLQTQEKITVSINKENQKITVKSGFQDLALGANAAEKELQNVASIMQQLHDNKALGFDAEGGLAGNSSVINKYIQSLQQLRTYRDSLSQEELFAPENQQRLSAMTLAVQNYRKQVEALLRYTAQYSNGNVLGVLSDSSVVEDTSKLKQSMIDIVSASGDSQKKFGELKVVTDSLGNSHYELSYTISRGKHEVQEMTAIMNPLTNEIIEQQGALKPVASAWDKFLTGFKAKFASIIQYTASITSIHSVISKFRQGLQYVKEIDAALTELKKVTDETNASYQRFLQDMSKTAGVVGSTVSELTTMSAEWARLGYTMEEAGKLAKSTAVLLNVSEFTDATTASEALISTMQAFSYTAEQSQHVVDILNEVGNNFAISSDGIATALQDSASALMEGGNNLEQSVALIAAANKVVQDPNSVGSALRTISLRLRGTSIEVLEEMGEETDGLAESVSKMQEKIKTLSGVDIVDVNGAYKDTYTILKEIGSVWEQMSDMDQAALLELMAGKNRANTLAAILGNMEDLNDAYVTALDSEGSALRENEEYLNSIQGRIDKLTNSFQTMWMNALESDTVKGIVDLARVLVEVVDSLGLINTIVGAITAKMALSKGSSFGSFFALGENGLEAGEFGKDIKEIFSIFSKEKEEVGKIVEGKDGQMLFSGVAGEAKAAGNAMQTAGAKAKLASIGVKALNTAMSFFVGIAVTAAISAVVKGIDKLIHKQELLNESAKEVLNAYSSAKKELSSINKTLDEVGSEFEKLSNGVDAFGNNINLSTSEYERYNVIINEIASMFPEMVTGYTEEGNAILACKGNVEELTAAYEAAAQAARQEAIAGAGDVFDAFKVNYDNTAVTRWGASGLKQQIDLANQLVDLLNNGDKDEISSFFQDGLQNDIDNMLEAAGIDRSSFYGLLSEDDIDRAKENLPKLTSFIKSETTKINVETNKVKSILDAYLGEDFDYAKLDSDTQNIVNSLVSNLSADFINGFDTADDLYVWIKSNIVDAFSDPELSKTIGNTVQQIASVQNQFKSGKMPIKIYRKEFLALVDDINTANIDPQLKEQIKDFFGLDLENGKSLGKDIDTMIAHVETLFGDNLTDEIRIKIGELDYSDLVAADGFIIPDEAFESWDKFVEYTEKNKTISFDLNYNAESEGLEKLQSALSETTTATGLSAEAVSNLKKRYEDLEGYNADELFEQTAHGIHVNVDAARELEEEYENINKSKLDDKLNTLVDEYNDLTIEIQNTADAYKRAELYNKRQDILNQINDTATLASRYEGLTSAYNKWQKAQSGAEERDMYEGIIEGKKEVDEEIARGWLDAGTREYIELLSGKDLSTASFEEILKIYKQLNKTIAGTKYDVYDFFTKDSDDNATVDGIYNFFDAVMAVQEEGKEWVKKNEDGSFVFDFSVNGGEEAIAEALGISEELVQIILRAASDAGFNINLDSAYADLAELKDEAILANEKLKKLGATDYDFNINSTNIDNLNEQIEKADQMLDKFRNQDGTVNIKAEGAKEAQTMLSTLIYQKQTLDDAAVLKVDTTNANAGVETVVKKLQNFKAAYNELEVKLAIGEDTTEAQAKLNDAITQLQMESPSIRAKLGIDLTKSNEEINAAINNISADKLIELGVDESKIEGYKAAEHTTEGEVIWTNNIDEVTSWMKKKHEVDGIVKWKNDDTGVNTFFSATGFGVVNGTAHAHGSAFAQGNWGASHTETALVGELGPEMVVRGDQWFTVGENGAEFTDIKKGDIIFNHKQTEDLLSNGYVTGRGKAYAAGTGALLSAQKEYNLAVAARKKAEKNNKGSWADIQNLNSAIDREKKALENYTNAKNIYYGITKSNAYKAYGSSEYKVHSDVYGAKGYGPSEALSKGLRKAGTDSGAGSGKDDSKQLIDFIEIKLEEIEAIISKTSAELTNYVDDTSSISQKNSAYDKLVNAEKEKAQTYFQAAEYYNKKAAELLEKVPESYREKAQNGAIDIKDFVGESQGKIAEAIQNYRDMANKADGAESSYLESIAQQAAYRVEQLEDIASDYDNIVNYIGKESTLIQAQMDLVEASGERLSADYYNELIQNTKEQIAQRVKEKQDLQEALDSGDIKVGTDEWYQAIDLIAEVDEEIIQCNTDIEEFKNSINDLKWEALDKLIARFDHLDSQLSHLHERLTDGKVVDDEGNWNEKGIAALGVLAQQMEVAEAKSKQYADAIDDLKKDYDNGLYSTDEYNEKLSELTEKQWDSIEAYEDAKDAIVDLNKTRIDAIKDGIKKELDAYKELIDKKKELLDADKDLHDFEKSVADQQKDISAIERRLAALSGDTSTAAAAERKQLEAELLEAQAALEEIYYDRSIENQKTALDEEYTNYEEVKNEEMEALDKYLEDEEKVISDSMDVVKKNTNTVLGEINKISKQYGVQISDSIVQPWKDGSNAISTFDNTFNTFSGSFMEQLQAIIAQEKALEEQAKLTAQALLDQLEAEQEASSGGSGYYFDYSYTGNSFSGYYDKNGNALTKDQLETELGTVGGIVYDGGGNAHDANTAKRPTTTSSSSSSNKSSSSSSKSGTVSNTKGNLGYGSSGADVKALQQSLNAMGYNCGSADGVFGAKTQAAVKQYQKDQGIKADGIVGTNTKKELKKDGYAKGTLGTSKSDWAWIDEIGEELVLHAGSDGKLAYLTKGTSVIPADLTSKLMDLAIDPTQTLENSKPVINAPHITNNEINIDMSFGSVVNIEHVDQGDIPDLTKAVEKQMDKYMKNLNNQIRKYSR